jgi:hypothetical protein
MCYIDGQKNKYSVQKKNMRTQTQVTGRFEESFIRTDEARVREEGSYERPCVT